MRDSISAREPIMTEHDARLVDLELRFMKLERFTHELSDVVAEQGQKIDRLTLEGEPPPDEKPPHY
jgi:predicted mannosyl-3-phosphoglycerate phosphatase (HAD superfamily)